MSSLVRRIERKKPRENGSYKGKPQPTILLPEGGYRTLHPTKGWLKFSGKLVKLRVP